MAEAVRADNAISISDSGGMAAGKIPGKRRSRERGLTQINLAGSMPVAVAHRGVAAAPLSRSGTTVVKDSKLLPFGRFSGGTDFEGEERRCASSLRWRRPRPRSPAVPHIMTVMA